MSFLGFDYINPVTIEAHRNEYLQRSRDGTLVGVSEGTHRWEVTVGLEPKSKDTYGGSYIHNSSARGMLVAHRAKHGNTIPFTFPMPIITVDIGSSEPNISQTAYRGQDTVSIPNGETLSGRATGSFVRFSNHRKVYMIESVTLQSGQPDTIHLVPNLVADVETTHTISFRPDLHCTYAPNSGGFFSMDGQSIVINRISVIEQ